MPFMDSGSRGEKSMSDKYLDSIVVNRGNQSRLKNVMRRAERGEKVNVGYLGGSIHLDRLGLPG